MHIKTLRILVHCIVFSYLYVILNVENKVCYGPLTLYSSNKEPSLVFCFKKILEKNKDFRNNTESSLKPYLL